MKKIQPQRRESSSTVRRHSVSSAVVSALVLVLVSLMLPLPACSPEITVSYGPGRQVTLPRAPQRIVSLAPSNTEILFALGLGEKVAGVTSYCDYPPEAKEKPSVGGFLDFSVEKIVSLQPDLVLATTGQEEALAPFMGTGVPVVFLDAATMAEVEDCVRVAGELTGTRREARQLMTEISRQIEAVSAKVAGIPESERPKVLYLAWDDPILTVGPGSLIHDMVTLAGGINVAASTGQAYPTYSMEMVLAQDPDVILLPRVHGGLDLAALKANPAWRSVEAVREGRVYLLDDNLISRPGPRAVQGLRQIAETLYPDLFKGDE